MANGQDGVGSLIVMLVQCNCDATKRPQVCNLDRLVPEQALDAQRLIANT